MGRKVGMMWRDEDLKGEKEKRRKGKKKRRRKEEKEKREKGEKEKRSSEGVGKFSTAASPIS